MSLANFFERLERLEELSSLKRDWTKVRNEIKKEMKKIELKLRQQEREIIKQ